MPESVCKEKRDGTRPLFQVRFRRGEMSVRSCCWGATSVCLCVCVCVRERERERERYQKLFELVKRSYVSLIKVIATTWENLQIEKHKAVDRERNNHLTDLCFAICRWFRGIVYHFEKPHAKAFFQYLLEKMTCRKILQPLFCWRWLLSLFV